MSVEVQRSRRAAAKCVAVFREGDCTLAAQTCVLRQRPSGRAAEQMSMRRGGRALAALFAAKVKRDWQAPIKMRRN